MAAKQTTRRRPRTSRELLRAGMRVTAALALLASCSAGPDFVRPRPKTPPDWSDTARQTSAPPAPAEAAGALLPEPQRQSAVTHEGLPPTRWWSEFRDPILTSLIERAVADNLDARIALVRIEEARAARDIAAAGLWPSVSANASYARERFSQTTSTGGLFSSVGKIRPPGGAAVVVPNPYNQFQLGANTSWELDVFGRVRRSVEAAQASVQVSVEDQRSVLLALLGDVASGYVELRGAQVRKAVALENLATVTELLELTRERRAAGLTTDLDVSNATAQVTATRAQLPLLDLQITQGVNQLSRLLGREPEALSAELDSGAAVPPVPPQVPMGLPAELARRRPDIREAEASLHAATAQIGVAVANLFPRLTFTAGGGFQSQTADELTRWASRFGSLGPALEVPILDRGRWKSIRLQKLKAQEAALAYERTVLDALHEVENAVAAYGADQDRRAWLELTVAQNHDALALARMRYEKGVANFIDVLDAERTLQQNQLSLAESTTAVSTDLVKLYRALGGDWES